MINKYQNILTGTLLSNCRSQLLPFRPVMSKTEMSDEADKGVGACVPVTAGVCLCMVLGEQFGNIYQNPFKIPVPFDSQPSLLLEMYSSGMLACPQRPWLEGTAGSGPSLSSHHPPARRPGTRPPPAATSSSEPPSGSSHPCSCLVSVPHSGAHLCACCPPRASAAAGQHLAHTWPGEWRWAQGQAPGGGVASADRTVEPVPSPGL